MPTIMTTAKSELGVYFYLTNKQSQYINSLVKYPGMPASPVQLRDGRRQWHRIISGVYPYVRISHDDERRATQCVRAMRVAVVGS